MSENGGTIGEGEGSDIELIPTAVAGKTEKRGLSEIELLRWENSLLKRELDLQKAAVNNERDTNAGESVSINNSSSSSQIKVSMTELSSLIPLFDPAKPMSCAKGWVKNVEQMAQVYSWDDKVLLLYATLRLNGAAKYWYQCQLGINNWGDFKTRLCESFPSSQNDSSVLVNIMLRRKRPEECVEEYFYHIVAMANSINLTEKDTMEYIISGLGDRGIINMLTAANCTNLTQLLNQIKRIDEMRQREKHRYILSNETYRTNKRKSDADDVGGHSTKIRRLNENKTIAERQDNYKENISNKNVKCFRCGKGGHFANRCKNTAIERKCFECNQSGHLMKECNAKKNTNVRQIMHKEKENDEYYKEISIDGVKTVAFIDMGSECTTLKEKIVKENGWVMERCDVILKGFAGGKCQSLGKLRKIVEVDGISLEVDIMIVNDNVQSTPMILGKNALDRPDIEIFKSWKTFRIQQKPASRNVLKISRDEKPIERSEINVNEKAGEENIKQLEKLLNEYRCCFAKNISELGKTNLVEMKIELKNTQPISYRPYKVAYGLKDVLNKIVKELLENDIIQNSTSEYASPVLLVSKKNGEYRMCIDYRKLNSVTKREIFPVANIEETLNSLANKKYFTSLDFMSGYHQIPIEQSSRKYTAFVTPEGHYEFKRVPFGLTNSPAVFMRMMQKLIENINTSGDDKIIVYMDDVLVATRTLQSNFDLLREIFEQLRKNNLTLKLEKCRFFDVKISFLGHEISIDGIKPGQAKTEAIANYKRPENQKEVRQFLGLAGYFRRFIRDFAKIARPLTYLLKKNSEFCWNEETENSFKTIKELLKDRPILALYDPDCEHEVHTDASSFGLAGILMQKDKSGTIKPISYFSRSTTDCESKYHSYELEALAVVESLERFKHYLLHKKFKIITDCNSLKMTQEKRNLIPRIARWWLKILEFDYELTYRSAKQLAHVDALSRVPGTESVEAETVAAKVLAISLSEEDWISTLQAQDKYLQHVKEVLDGTITDGDDIHGIRGNYILKNGRIFKVTDEGDRFVVPRAIRWRILKMSHDDMGHCGWKRTLENMKKLFWFQNMKQAAQKYVNACVDCLFNKRGPDESNYKIYTPVKVSIPFHTVHIDYLGPFPKSSKGNMHLFGIIDAFTKFIVIKPTKATTTRSAIIALDEVAQYFGIPHRIISDRGAAFTAKEFSKYCNDNDIKHVLTAVQTPRANGQIERYFRTIKTSIATMSKDLDGKDWDKHVKAIQWALNSMKQTTTNKTPQELLVSFKPRNILQNKLILALQQENEEEDPEENIPLAELRKQVLERMTLSQQKQAEKKNAKLRAPQKYNKGDLVLVKTQNPATGQPKKTQPRFRGPYEVKEVLNHDRYLIGDTNEMQISQKAYNAVQSAERLKKWCELDDMSWGDSSDNGEESDE